MQDMSTVQNTMSTFYIIKIVLIYLLMLYTLAQTGIIFDEIYDIFIDW